MFLPDEGGWCFPKAGTSPVEKGLPEVFVKRGRLFALPPGWQLSIVCRQLSLGTRHSALGTQHSALGTQQFYTELRLVRRVVSVGGG